jgi:TolA-binding protein
MKSFYRLFLLSACVILASVLLSSCYTAYFNTFYNAKKYFESAQKRPLNAQGRPQSAAIEDYNRVIRKCGVILTEFKDSKWADNALFLLARALFYRGQNQLQAIQNFEDLIQFYPDSPFHNQAILYIARVKFELNQKDEAYEILRNFIQNPSYREDHPQALILISEMYIQDRNYLDAQFYLAMLTERFPRSKRLFEAYVLLGKTHFDNNNFDASLRVFYELSSKRRVPRNILHDAQYYIAFNYFHLGQYSQAYKTIRNLERRESRTEKENEQSILHARIIAEMGRIPDALEKLESVISNSPRSLASAEAAFYIAEMQFLKLHEYESAIENYNRVRRESARSDFVDRALSRSAVASQILQYYNPTRTLTATQLIAEQLKLAEFYLYELSLPDSALVIYKKIPVAKLMIQAQIDSLSNLISLYEAEAFSSAIDSLQINGSFSAINGYAVAEKDSLDIASLDTLAEVEEPSIIDIDEMRAALEVLQTDLELYATQFVPRSYFMRLVVNRIFFNNEEQVKYLAGSLNEGFPDNRYTEAAYEFMNGMPVTYLTRTEKRDLARFDYASSYILLEREAFLESFDNVIGILDSLKNTNLTSLRDKTLYTLGFLHFISKGDSLKARPYFDELLEVSPTSNYAAFVRLFYNGTHFISHDRLPTLVEYERRRTEREREMERRREQEIQLELERELLEEAEEIIEDDLRDDEIIIYHELLERELINKEDVIEHEADTDE